MQLAANIGPDRLGHARRTALIQGRIGNIEIGLIQRQGFNPVGIALEDGPQGGRDLLVHRHPSRQHRQAGTQTPGMGRGHRRMDAKAPRHIVAGGDHPTSIRLTANRQRNVAQRRVVPHLDRGKEAIHVDMNDLSHAIYCI